jgi:hypothetical protein
MNKEIHEEFIQWCSDEDWITKNYRELLYKYENQQKIIGNFSINMKTNGSQ